MTGMSPVSEVAALRKESATVRAERGGA